MTDRAPSEPASFSGHDRRRLATALRRTSDVRLFRRVQAMLRVAEGDPWSLDISSGNWRTVGEP
jgi:hypothetical protein